MATMVGKCNVPIQPMADWIKEGIEMGESAENCRPCLVMPTAEYYLGLLEKESGLKHDLLKAYETGEVEIICKAFDDIKAKAPEELKVKLEEIDCETQSFKMEE